MISFSAALKNPCRSFRLVVALVSDGTRHTCLEHFPEPFGSHQTNCFLLELSGEHPSCQQWEDSHMDVRAWCEDEPLPPRAGAGPGLQLCQNSAQQPARLERSF